MRNDLAALPAIVDDVHSRLNRTRVAAIVAPASAKEAGDLIRKARRGIAIAGARHAMGGQQFLRDGLLLDTSKLDRVLAFDATRGTITVEAGIRWPALLAWLREHGRGWTIRQKQTGADDFSVGGAVAANIHGRGLTLAPFGADVETLAVLDGEGRAWELNRNFELFSHVIGGYGLFGLTTAVTLRLARRATLVRRVALARTDDLHARLERAIADGARYGDFQFDIDPASRDFCARGILSCYYPGVPADAPRKLEADGWRRLLRLAHVDKTRAFEEYAAFYLSTDGQTYDSDTQQTGVYVDRYHDAIDAALGHRGSETIGEWYVPRERLAHFLAACADCLRRERADPIYGTVRLIERDRDSALPWARERWACVVLNVHVAHDARSIARAKRTFRALNDLALAEGGSFYLTYQRWASAAQVEAAYPAFRSWLRRKRQLDPFGVFASDWYRHWRRAFGGRES